MNRVEASRLTLVRSLSDDALDLAARDWKRAIGETLSNLDDGAEFPPEFDTLTATYNAALKVRSERRVAAATSETPATPANGAGTPEAAKAAGKPEPVPAGK